MDPRPSYRRAVSLDHGPAPRRGNAVLSTARTSLEASMTRIGSITFVCLLGVTLPCGAGVCKQSSGAATLEVCFDADTAKLSLADTILVKLTIEGSAALNVFGAPLD